MYRRPVTPRLTQDVAGISNDCSPNKTIFGDLFTSDKKARGDGIFQLLPRKVYQAGLKNRLEEGPRPWAVFIWGGEASSVTTRAACNPFSAASLDRKSFGEGTQCTERCRRSTPWTTPPSLSLRCVCRGCTVRCRDLLARVTEYDLCARLCWASSGRDLFGFLVIFDTAVNLSNCDSSHEEIIRSLIQGWKVSCSFRALQGCRCRLGLYQALRTKEHQTTLST